MTRSSTGQWRFRPGLWPSLGAVALIALTISLGNWQTRRAEEKLELARLIDEGSRRTVLELPGLQVRAAEYEFDRVSVRGEYVPQKTIYLDNKVYRGIAGYHVLTPLRIEGSNLHVLVNRGWVAGGGQREVLPKSDAPSGTRTIEGIAVIPSGRFVELAEEQGEGPVVQNLVIERIAKRSGLEFQPVVIQQTSDASDNLVRAWERPDTGVDKHRGYALQWYSIAGLTAVLYVALNLRREPKPA